MCLQCDYVLDVSAVADELPELTDAAFSELSGVFPGPAGGDHLIGENFDGEPRLRIVRLVEACGGVEQQFQDVLVGHG